MFRWICNHADHRSRLLSQRRYRFLVSPKPFFKKDEAKQDLMIVVPPRYMLLEELIHRSRAKVLVDLGVAVTQSIGHFIVDGTLEPIIHHVDRKSAFRPFQNRPRKEAPDLPV